MHKRCKFVSMLIIFSLNLSVLNLGGYASNNHIQNVDYNIKYDGTVEELPEYIYKSYKANEKAESLDVYDQNLYSVTTNNNDGTKTIELYQTPIKYIEEDEIKFIDTAIESISVLERVVSKYQYKCETTPVF